MLVSILTVILVMAAVSIITLVLLQQGKGADMGAAFGGGGSSQSLFGSRGSATFLSRATAILAAVFFVSALSLAYLYTGQVRSNVSVTSRLEAPSNEDSQPTLTEQSVGTKSDLPTVPEAGGDQ